MGPGKSTAHTARACRLSLTRFIRKPKITPTCCRAAAGIPSMNMRWQEKNEVQSNDPCHWFRALVCGAFLRSSKKLHTVTWAFIRALRHLNSTDVPRLLNLFHDCRDFSGQGEAAGGPQRPLDEVRQHASLGLPCHPPVGRTGGRPSPPSVRTCLCNARNKGRPGEAWPSARPAPTCTATVLRS